MDIHQVYPGLQGGISESEIGASNLTLLAPFPNFEDNTELREFLTAI
jgi:hypothetical protein